MRKFCLLCLVEFCSTLRKKEMKAHNVLNGKMYKTLQARRKKKLKNKFGAWVSGRWVELRLFCRKKERVVWEVRPGSSNAIEQT